MTMPSEQLHEIEVDTLVVGAGGGGMTAAMAAKAAGLNTLLVEKSEFFGGSTSLSGGGIWVPGATVQVRAGYEPDPEQVFEYLKAITAGLVSDRRLRTYVETGPEMLDFVAAHTDSEFVWKPGYPDYFPEVPGGSPRGSVINVEPIDMRMLGDDEGKLLRPLALAPRGMWLRPLELKSFFTIRQSWRGKVVLLRFVWRMLRARVLGERVAAMGQALAAHLWLGLRKLGVQVWLDSPLVSLITGDDGEVQGAIISHEGREIRVRAKAGVILATGGFEHDPALRAEYQPFVPENHSFGSQSNTGDGIRAGQQAGAALDLMDEAWWFPTLAWPGGRQHMLLNERMMPAQFIVNGDGRRFINEATPYSEFGHAMIEGQASGTTHMPCWLITDAGAWNRYVIAGHLPLPKIPFSPAPTGHGMVASWLQAGVVQQADSWAGLAEQIGVPADALEATALRYNEVAATGHDDDFGRGDSAYDRYYGDETLANPCLAPLGGPPFYAFRIVLGDLGTNGGLMTDEYARVLRDDGRFIPGLYATGNTSAAVMGRTYAGAGATIGPAMAFGYIAARHQAAALRPAAPADVLSGHAGSAKTGAS
jgi:succinate dehydrogenase/fumarate reductase flavoprotein subunit